MAQTGFNAAELALRLVRFGEQGVEALAWWRYDPRPFTVIEAAAALPVDAQLAHALLSGVLYIIDLRLGLAVAALLAGMVLVDVDQPLSRYVVIAGGALAEVVDEGHDAPRSSAKRPAQARNATVARDTSDASSA